MRNPAILWRYGMRLCQNPHSPRHRSKLLSVVPGFHSLGSMMAQLALETNASSMGTCALGDGGAKVCFHMAVFDVLGL